MKKYHINILFIFVMGFVIGTNAFASCYGRRSDWNDLGNNIYNAWVDDMASYNEALNIHVWRLLFKNDGNKPASISCKIIPAGGDIVNLSISIPAGQIYCYDKIISGRNIQKSACQIK